MNHKLIGTFIFFLLLSFDSGSTTENNCLDSEDRPNHDFEYKKVVLEDLSALTTIDPTKTIGSYIRFKMNGIDFLEANITDNYCCMDFQ